MATPIDSQDLRKALTLAAQRGVSPKALYQELEARGYEVQPDTVRRVQEHYRTVTPAEPAPEAPAATPDATAPAEPAPGGPLTPEDMAQIKEAMHPADIKMLPTIGAVLGGKAGEALGVPLTPIGMHGLGIGGAGLGGGTGKAVENLLEGKPLTEDVVKEAGLQAVYEAGGRGVLGVAKKIGRFAGPYIAQAAMKVTPEAAQAVIRNGITATKSGLAKAEQLMNRQLGGERQIVAAASRQGLRYDPTTKLANPVYTQVLHQLEGAPDSEIAKLDALYKDFVDSNKGPMAPSKVLSLRKYNDNQIQALHRAAAKGTKPVYNVQNLWEKALADHSRDLLRETVPAIRDPQAYMKLTGNETLPDIATQVFLATEPASKKSVMPRLVAGSLGGTIGAGVGAALPGDNQRRFVHGSEGALIGAALSSPAALSHMALLHENPLLQQFLLNTPRGLGLLMNQSE